MFRYRLRIGNFYYGDPEHLGLSNPWTTNAHQAVPFTLEQALIAIRAAVNSVHLQRDDMTLEPIL